MRVDLRKMIKGRIAETIVEELFREMGFRVFRYGMENTIPGIIPLIENGSQNPVSRRLRQAPDLVVYKDGTAHFVEVKFRADETFTLADIETDAVYPYPDALFVVVSPAHIKCISYPELKAGQAISPGSMDFLLGKRPEFATDAAIIKEYRHTVTEIFRPIG